MWKKVLQVLIESCAYMDPYGCLYLAAAKREAAEQGLSQRDEADEQQLRRLVDRLEYRREAQA